MVCGSALAGIDRRASEGADRWSRKPSPDASCTTWSGARRAEIGAVRVARTLTNLYPIVAGWLAEDERPRAIRARWGGFSSATLCSSTLERRRLRLLGALYKTLEAQAVDIVCERNAHFAEFRHERDRVNLDLKEYIAQKRRPLSDQERAHGWGDQKYRVEQTRTGRLRGRVEAYLPAGVPVLWTETEEEPFEDVLGDVVATILTALAKAKASREECERQERARLERQEAESASAGKPRKPSAHASGAAPAGQGLATGAPSARLCGRGPRRGR